MTVFPRRAALACLAGPALAGLAPWARAQASYPDKTVTLVVPQAAGGANDVIARVLAHALAQQTGQSFVVENRPGAGGTLATAATARARRDGYTLLLTSDSAQVIGPALYRNPGFDAVGDFAAVAPVATAAYVLVAHPDFPAQDMAGLIKASRQRPGAYAVASAGNGTLNHLIAQMLQKAAALQWLHVPYQGAAAAASAVASGQVAIGVQSLPSALSLVQAGKLKVLAVVNPQRVQALPQVPTLSETLPGFAQSPWYAVFAPKGTPESVLAVLQTQINEALASEPVRQRLASVGCQPFIGTAAQLAALVHTDLAKWATVVQESGVSMD